MPTFTSFPFGAIGPNANGVNIGPQPANAVWNIVPIPDSGGCCQIQIGNQFAIEQNGLVVLADDPGWTRWRIIDRGDGQFNILKCIGWVLNGMGPGVIECADVVADNALWTIVPPP